MYKITVIFNEEYPQIEEYVEDLLHMQEILDKYPEYLTFRAEKIETKVRKRTK